MLLPIFSFVLLADGVVFRFPLTTIRLCVRSMSTVALSALLAVAAATSGALAQTTSLTPLVDFTYAYSDLVSLCNNFSLSFCLTLACSPTKWSPRVTSVVTRKVTTFVTRRPRTRNPGARPCSSMALMAR